MRARRCAAARTTGRRCRRPTGAGPRPFPHRDWSAALGPAALSFHAPCGCRVVLSAAFLSAYGSAAVLSPPYEPTAQFEPTAVLSAPHEPTDILSTPHEPTAVLSAPHEPTAVLSAPHEPTAVLSAPLEPTAVLSTPHEPTAVLSAPHEPTAVLSAPHQPTAVLSAPHQPTAVLSPPHEPTAVLAEPSALLAIPHGQTADCHTTTHGTALQPYKPHRLLSWGAVGRHLGGELAGDGGDCLGNDSQCGGASIADPAGSRRRRCRTSPGCVYAQIFPAFGSYFGE